MVNQNEPIVKTLTPRVREAAVSLISGIRTDYNEDTSDDPATWPDYHLVEFLKDAGITLTMTDIIALPGRDDPLLDLAYLALRTLNAQQQYFKSRHIDALKTAKQFESDLRAAATAVVDARQEVRT